MTRRRAKTRRQITNEHKVAVTCPICAVGPTVPCQGPDGNEISPHHRRTQLAQAIGM